MSEKDAGRSDEMNGLATVDRGTTSVAQVRKELDASRQKLATTADALREDLSLGVADLREGAQKLKQKLNWKNWVAKNPWGFVVGAVAVGIFLGTRNRS